MVVMEGDRQAQGGWYEGGAGAGAGAASPLPTAQHHQVRDSPGPRGRSLSSPCQDASTNDSDNYFKPSSTASQYFMQSYGGIQSHGEYNLLTRVLGGQQEGIKIISTRKLPEHQPLLT